MWIIATIFESSLWSRHCYLTLSPNSYTFHWEALEIIFVTHLISHSRLVFFFDLFLKSSSKETDLSQCLFLPNKGHLQGLWAGGGLEVWGIGISFWYFWYIKKKRSLREESTRESGHHLNWVTNLMKLGRSHDVETSWGLPKEGGRTSASQVGSWHVDWLSQLCIEVDVI